MTEELTPLTPLTPLTHAQVWKDLEAWLWASEAERGRGARLGPGSVAVLTGPAGVGKSEGVQRLVARMGWDTVVIDQEKTTSPKDFQEVITKGLTTNLLQALSGEPRPRVMLLDNADALFLGERMYVTQLGALLTATALPHMPVLITCSYAAEKRLMAGPVGGGARRFLLPPIPEADLFLYLRERYRMPAGAAMRVAEAANGSIGAARVMAEAAMGSAAQAQDVVADQPMLYTARREDARQVRSLVADRLWMTPLLFHENLPAELERRRGTQRAKLDYYRDYLWALATWDVWMASAGSDNASHGSEEYPVELVTGWVLRMGELFPARGSTGGGGGAVGGSTGGSGGAVGGGGAAPEEFTRLFSTLSIQKKTARAGYRPDGPF